MQSETMIRPRTLNGLDIDAAMATIEAIRADPEIAQFRFRARNRWISGGENRSTIKGFYGARQEDSSRSEAFEFTNGSRRSCSAGTKAPIRSSSCCMRSPDA